MTFTGHIEAQFTVPSGVEIAVTTNAAGPTTVAISGGTYFHATFSAQLQADLIAGQPVTGGTWSVSYSTVTGKYTIAVTNGTYSITWTSTTLRNLLGITSNQSAVTTHTGASQARGLWIPDCILRADREARRAPLSTDHRNTVGPTGQVYGFKSTKLYRHTNLVYSHVPADRTWEGSALTTNASYEQFVKDTQLSEGHSWFALSSKLRITDHNGVLLGNDASVASWTVTQLPGLDTIRMSEGITNGLFYVVEWPEIVSTA